jgi:cell pole-organizing protein PopZ
MSDPLTRAEIEDVLSSIRRLVSEEVRLPPGPRAGGGTAAAAAGRLVLTPDQRIGAGEAAPAPPAPSLARGPDPITTIRDAARRFAEAEAAATARGWTAPVAAASDCPAPSLEETIAELEAAVAVSGGQWEPDGSELAAARGAVAEAAAPLAGNVHELAVPRRPVPHAPPAMPEGLDADALRDLVAEVVRQELQGVLGERITRTVRKLVRAEIARALASHQFD